MVDLPTVTLEVYNDGDWKAVQTDANRPVTDSLQDILLTHTPDPLYPVEVVQTHTWWATWQAVGHVNNLTSLPTGSYRLVIEGEHWTGDEASWPWTTESYRIETPSWELIPADISLERTDSGLNAWIQAPAQGYRLVDLQGNSQGSNPIRGQLTIEWGTETGTEGSTEIMATSPVENRTPLTLDLTSAKWVSVTDEFGNTGRLDW